MRGFNTKKAQSCKDGGLIRGPGTGTSDSIPRGFKPGTFIMPADSTKAIGPDVLENIAKVPTKVSNGEFAHTPQEVHAIGINALRMMKDATHSPKEAGVYFANGGTVRGRSAKGFAIGGEVTNDVTRVGNSYSGGNVGGDITVNGQQPGGSFSSASPVNPVIPSAPTSAPVAPDMPIPPRREPVGFDPVQAAQRFAGGGAVEDQYGYLPGESIMDRVRRKLTPSGGGAPLELGAPNAMGMPTQPAGAGRGYINPSVASPDQPATTTNATNPAPEALTDVQRGGGSAPAMPDATPAPAPGAAAAMQTMPGVYNHGRGQYSDSASGMGMPASFTGQPNSQNMAAADSLAARGFTPNSMPAATSNPTRGFSPPTIANSTNNWQAANDLRNARVSASSITANGGRFDQTRKGQMSPQAATYAAMLDTDQALQKAQPGMAKAALDANAGLQREGMQQTGATQRAGLGFQTAQQRLAMDKETQGFANRAAGQFEQLRNTLLDPNATTEQKAQAQSQISALNGGQNGEWGVQVTPATKNIDGSTTAGSIVKYNKRTGETATVGDTGQGAPSGPKVGAVEGGYRFKGGDPSNHANWEKA